ncbi:MAG: response regulator, partial [Spirochaetia bacterium]|nr:response regulator [Spirochaetia bacterium]
MTQIHPLGNINRKEPFGRKKDGTHYRVLVVDDSSVMRKMLVQILKS